MSAWTQICRYDDLVVDRGVAAIVDGIAVAVFRLVDGTVVAVDNHDPISGANIMSRGLIGTKGELTYLASPMYKQRFDIETGICLDNDDVLLPVYVARVSDGLVEARVSATSADVSLAS